MLQITMRQSVYSDDAGRLLHVQCAIVTDLVELPLATGRVQMTGGENSFRCYPLLRPLRLGGRFGRKLAERMGSNPRAQ
jgi:hypothetical protein